MNKQEFLKTLNDRLSGFYDNDVKDVINYYEELISERIEVGEKEEDIVKGLNIDEIIGQIKADLKVKQVEKNPTMSNSVKAIIAVLGVFSIPILIPIAIVIVSLIFAFLAVIAAFIISAFAIVISLVAVGIGAIILFFTGTMPFFSMLFIVGAMLLCIGLSSMAGICLIRALKVLISSLAKMLGKLLRKKEGK